MKPGNHPLPERFVQRMSDQLGDQLDAFLETMNSPLDACIRLHPEKKATAYEFELTDQVSWANNAYFLKSRPVFTLDPIFQAGGYYVQEPSSMLVERIIQFFLEGIQSPVVLDLCAAPGGKSTCILSALKGRGVLVSNELISNRVQPLQHNLIKWGYANQIITNSDASRFKALPHFFDLILVDVPCSGEGLFRKDISSRAEWSEENAGQCSLRQRRILADVFDALKPGGTLLYSTCTYNPAENLDQLNYLTGLGMESLPISFSENYPLIKLESTLSWGYQAYPHLFKGEGFFIGALRKTDIASKAYLQPRNGNLDWQPIPNQIDDWISPDAGLNYFKHRDIYYAFPEHAQDQLEQCSAVLKLVEAGTAIGQLKQYDFIPAHSWSQSIHCNKTMSAIPVEKERALRYLRKESLPNDSKDLGYLTLMYQGLRLGWVKGIPDRLNNLYPKQYRILMNR